MYFKRNCGHYKPNRNRINLAVFCVNFPHVMSSKFRKYFLRLNAHNDRRTDSNDILMSDHFVHFVRGNHIKTRKEETAR